MPETAGIVIVGGGVMGCSILYHLAARGMADALLLERDTLGSGSTGRSSGAVRMHYSTAVHAQMAWHSLSVFENFAELVGGECGFVRTGYLVFAGEDDAPGFRANLAVQQAAGIQTAEISRREAADLAPGFYLDDCAGIAYEPRSGHADSSATTLAYAARARAMGARIRLQSPAAAIEVTGGRVTAALTAQGRIETPQAVIATGPWSRRFLLRQGIDLPLTATRHEVVHLRRPLAELPHHPGGGDIANMVYFRPEGSELTLVGNGNLEDEIDDPEVYAQRASQAFIGEVWSRLARRIPAMAGAEFAAGYAGLYTSTPDSHPVMDKLDGIEGLYICTGFSGHGFKLSPAVGLLMAELILDGQASTIDIAPLRQTRFAENDLNLPSYGFKVLA